jgi:hypothetical protein
MDTIGTTMTEGLSERGWDMQVIGIDLLSARMMATDPSTGEWCELDILEEAFGGPPESTPYGPVLALDDVIGTKVRALAGRDLPTRPDRHSRGVRSALECRVGSSGPTACPRRRLQPRRLKARLDGAEWYDDQASADYGLSEEDIAHLRAWAQAWSDDINRRLYQAVIDEDDLPYVVACRRDLAACTVWSANHGDGR